MSARDGAKPPLAVLWDLDGVLVDTSRYHLAAWRRLMADFGRKLSDAQFRSTFGMRNREILHQLLPEVPASEAEALSDRKEEYFRKLLPRRIRPMPGARRLIARLKSAGIPQAIASSTPRANLETILPRAGLAIDVYVAAEDVARGKPSPDVFLKAAERLDVPPERCVVFEDSVAGVEAAHRAGMACVAVTTTWPREKLSDADLVVDSLEEVSVEKVRQLVGAEAVG